MPRAPARAVRARPTRSASTLAASGHAPLVAVVGAGDHRHAALPASSRGRCATSPGATTRSASTSTSACAAPIARSPSATRCARSLPDLLALSATSPWHEGRDTHLRSTRSQLFTRMFPRCGIPDAFDELGRATTASCAGCSRPARSASTPRSGGACARTSRSARSRCATADALPDVRESIAVCAPAGRAGGARSRADRRGRAAARSARAATSRRTCGARSAGASTAS